jgi:hypothetical protein
MIWLIDRVHGMWVRARSFVALPTPWYNLLHNT